MKDTRDLKINQIEEEILRKEIETRFHRKEFSKKKFIFSRGEGARPKEEDSEKRPKNDSAMKFAKSKQDRGERTLSRASLLSQEEVQRIFKVRTSLEFYERNPDRFRTCGACALALF